MNTIPMPRDFEGIMSCLCVGIGTLEGLKGIGPEQFRRANEQLTRLQLVLSVLDPNR